MSDLSNDPASGQAQPKLLVFLHVALKQRAFQSELQTALSGVLVTAVGRIGDFERGLKEGQDAVLTLPLVLAAYGLKGTLQGLRKGSPNELYALAGVDVMPEPSRVGVVGVLDLLGREGMKGFVQDLMGSQPRIERVTKVEDLLPLLQMQRVDAILLPARLLGEVQASSRLNLPSRELPRGIALPAVASIGARGAGVLSAVKALPASLASTMGVNEWR
jgi:hypothetical protein